MGFLQKHKTENVTVFLFPPLLLLFLRHKHENLSTENGHRKKLRCRFMRRVHDGATPVAARSKTARQHPLRDSQFTQVNMSYYGSDPNSQSAGGGFYGNTSSTAGGYNAAGANVQSWQQTTTSSQQQQQPYAPVQQQTAAPAAASVFNPAAAAAMAAVSMSGSGGHDAAFNAISTAGQSFFQEGVSRMIPGLESTVMLLRTYFAVDNRYVMRKIQKVLVPFFSKDWQRQVSAFVD